jgi:hypothetical protein
MNSITALQGQIKGRRQIIDYNKGKIQNASTGSRAEGYVPNFAGVMMNDQEKLVRGFREKMAVMGSDQYSSAQKRRAKPKMAHGFNKFRDAILTPKMMAGGYVPNFYSKYNLPNNMSLSQLMNEMTLAKQNRGGGATRGYRNELARRYKAARLGAKHFGGQLSGSRTSAYANIWNQDRWVNRTGVSQQRGNMLRNRHTLGMRRDLSMSLHGTKDFNNWTDKPNHWKTQAARSEGFYNQRGIQTRSRTTRLGNRIGGAIAARRSARASRIAGVRSTQATNQSAYYKRLRDMYQAGKVSPKQYVQISQRIAQHGRTAVNAAKYGKYAAGAGRLAMGAGRMAMGGPHLALLYGGDLIGQGLGKGMEHLVGRELSDDDKNVGGWGYVPGGANIARSVKAGTGLVGSWTSGGWSIGGQSASEKGSRGLSDRDLRNKFYSGRRVGKYRGENINQFIADYKKGLAYNIKQEKDQQGTMTRGYAGGYIPNFARGSSLSGLFSNFSKGAHQQKMRQMMDIQRWGAPGLGHIYKPQFINSAMNTPGFKGDILRGMGGGEHFRSYPKTGSFYANGYVPNFSGGVAASQARERRQSGRSDVYTKMINGFGPATFNGSERGMEESIVRNHPNPRSAGMAAEGYVPNFAGLEKNIKSMTDNLGLLNETMSMSGSGGGSASGASGNLSVSMAPMNVSINGGGGDGMAQGLTTQLDEFRRMVGETFASMGVSPMTGPPV